MRVTPTDMSSLPSRSEYYKSRDLHTHPVDQYKTRQEMASMDYSYRKGGYHREAAPSGLGRLLHFSKGKFQGFMDSPIKQLTKTDGTGIPSSFRKQMGVDIPHFLNNQESDMSAYSGGSKNSRGHQKNIFNILGIGSKTVSAIKPGMDLKDTKYLSIRPRIVYFDHTPRKAK